MARGLACSARDWPKERPKGGVGGVSVSGAAPGGTGAENGETEGGIGRLEEELLGRVGGIWREGGTSLVA